MKNKFCLWLSLFAIVLSAIFPLSVCALAQTEAAGLITEMQEGGFLLEDETLGLVLVRVDDATLLDGILAGIPLAAGQYVFVTFNGIMSRSFPPQILATHIACHTLAGTVGSLTEKGFLLTGDTLFGDVLVHAENFSLANIRTDMQITVYYNGVIAMSLPAQATARYLDVPMVCGTIQAADDGTLLVLDEDGVSHTFAVNKGTALPKDWDAASAPGKRVTVYHMGTESDPLAKPSSAIQVLEGDPILPVGGENKGA